MLDRLDLWDRFNSIEFWWMHAMLAFWTPFAVLLFVIDRIVVHRRFEAAASRRPGAAPGSLPRPHRLRSALVC